tara:strand:- start:5347 stop:6048 length:702 start_codon:yes stop_codon:yes gene_type:complete
MSGISIIIPVYNESELIKSISMKLLTDIKKSNNVSDFEIILIENGSSDNSDLLVDELSRMDERIMSLHLDKPDYGLALKTGIKHASKELIINFSVDFIDLNFLHEALLIIKNCDVVMGSYNIDTFDRRSFTRRLGSNVYNSLSSFILGENVKGSHGFKLMKSCIVKNISEQCYMTKDIFDDEMIYRLIKKQHKIVHVPLVFRDIRKPRSGIFIRGLRAFVLLIYLKILISFKG